tara:strand:+ start:2739 stop:3116 length:378 start_codon:yes stop_codon:yes gene_type:complete
MNTYSAILSLVPNAKFAITDNNYNSIEWFDARDKPSETDVINEVNRLIADEPMRLLRVERDKRLAETDWVVAKAIETGGTVSDAWKTYRQALRDLPSSATPVLGATIGGNYDPGIRDVTWPTKPS